MVEIPTNRSRRGLKFKFILLINLLVIAVGSIVGAILLIGLKHSYEDQLQKRGLAIAHSITTNSLFAIASEDRFFLDSIIQGLSLESDIAYAIILNKNGKVIAHSDEREIGKTLNDPSTKQAMEASQSRIFEYGQNSEKLYEVVAPAILKPLNAASGEKAGVIRLGVSLKNMKLELRKFLLITLSTLLVLISVAIFGSLFFAGIIITPIERITSFAVQIAQGDLSQTIKITAQDEVGVLVAAFSQMSAGLKGMIKRIQDASLQVNQVADRMRLNTKKVSDGSLHQANAAEATSLSIEQMNVSVQNISETIEGLSSSSQAASSSLIQMSAAINQVASSTTTLSTSVENTASSLVEMSSAIQQVAENVDTLSASAEETTSSINEMNASIKEVGKNATEAASLTEKVSQDAAELGTTAIEKTIEGMEKIKKTVDQSAYVINKLDERTKHIGKILTVIDEVTRQTNLLALNAAILAAQAGNEGKGFAVVSNEIKSLADRTATSTKEIAQLIKDVQSEAKDAVVSIKEGARSVEEGIHLSTNARESLSTILRSSKRSSEMSRLIEKATLEQVKATNQVTELMGIMNVMIQQISAAMNELGKGTLNITEASEKMRMITGQVRISTEEQAQGSKQISEAVENVTLRIQQIAEATSEQKSGHGIIRNSIGEIRQITQVNVEMVQQMNEAVESLIDQAKLLNIEISRFKV